MQREQKMGIATDQQAGPFRKVTSMTGITLFERGIGMAGQTQPCSAPVGIFNQGRMRAGDARVRGSCCVWDVPILLIGWGKRGLLPAGVVRRV